MGLFKRKEPCSICGGEVSRISGYKLTDGVLCSNCRSKCTQYLSFSRGMSVADIRRNMADNIANQALYQTFEPQHIGNHLHVDFQNKLWCIGWEHNLESRQSYIFRFSDLAEYEFIEDGERIRRSEMPRALRKGYLFGEQGIFKKEAKDSIETLTIVIKVNSEWTDTVKIDIVNSTLKKDTLNYNNHHHMFEHIVKALEAIRSQQS